MPRLPRTPLPGGTPLPATSPDPPGGDSSGPLGPALESALRDYQHALGRLTGAEAAVERARREASEARARLQALATGARLTGTRVLVAVDPPPEVGAPDSGADSGDGDGGGDQA